MVRIEDPTTARDLAIRHGLTEWPDTCPSCGDGTPGGRTLQDQPGRHGEARYLCANCVTTFARTRWAVAHKVRGEL